jgi:hypothetical protein
VTVGKKTLEDGKIDVLQRADRSEERVDLADAPGRIGGML